MTTALQDACDAWMKLESRQELFKSKPASLCYAPFAHLHFRQDGAVCACCMNEEPLGNLKINTLDEIWHGEKIKKLRHLFAAGRLGPGCGVCARFLADGDPRNAPMRYFDDLPMAGEWPDHLDFSLSNSCNLQCVMCHGLASSAIRQHRDHLPPLENAYSGEVLDAMHDYLIHAKTMRFAGGEPFLIREYFTIWDMLIDNGLQAKAWDGSPGVRCWLTTNATQYHWRVEYVLAHIPMGIEVSMDGATRKTVEAIRIGINYDQFMTNARRLCEYTKDRKTFFQLAMCFMQQNWFEFEEMCLRADEWDCDLNCNFVVNPDRCSMLAMPAEQLREVLASMERSTLTLEHQLTRNRKVWFTALEKIRARARAVGV